MAITHLLFAFNAGGGRLPRDLFAGEEARERRVPEVQLYRGRRSFHAGSRRLRAQSRVPVALVRQPRHRASSHEGNLFPLCVRLHIFPLIYCCFSPSSLLLHPLPLPYRIPLVALILNFNRNFSTRWRIAGQPYHYRRMYVLVSFITHQKNN